MKKLSIVGMSALLIAVCAVGCGDDTDDNPGATAGTTGEGGEGNGTAGTKNTAGTSGSKNTAGSKSDGGETGTAGTTGEGGGAGGSNPPIPCDVYGDRPVEVIPADAEGNITTELLSADKVWSLNGRLYVPEGKTLTIEPCTRIEGTPKPNAGALFVMQGAKINAVGTADAPIVFTSEDKTVSANPWGGVVLLGNAPIAPAVADETDPVRIYEGLTDPRASYGGDDPEDDSGEIAFVRIEFGGDIIVTEPKTKEINGLSFGAVGSKTKVHHIFVKDQADDCYEWFGGTMNADHLICQNSGDDMFDTDEGFKGHLQYLFGRNLVAGTSDDPNGFEWDGNQLLLTAPEATLGTPQASNATVCGFKATEKVSYGGLLRRSLADGTLIQNAIVTGWNFGVDARDAVGTTEAPLLSWTNSLFFEQITADGANPADDDAKDGNFNEATWLAAEANANGVGADVPAGFDCYADVPSAPTAAVEGATPGDGFDAAGTFIGAGDLSADDWAPGSWMNWALPE